MSDSHSKKFSSSYHQTLCVYACSPTNTLSFAACCSATISLIKLADYGSKDPPSAWTTGSDHTNGSGTTPSAPVPWVEFSAQPLSLSQRECTRATLLCNRDVYFYTRQLERDHGKLTLLNAETSPGRLKSCVFLSVVCSTHWNVFRFIV